MIISATIAALALKGSFYVRKPMILAVKKETARIYEIDSTNGQAIRSFAEGLVTTPHDLALIPGTETIAVIDSGDISLKLIDLQTGALQDRFTLPAKPRWVTAVGSSEILVWFNVSTNEAESFGVTIDTEYRRATKLFTTGGHGQIQGVASFDKKIYGVTKSGLVCEWLPSGGDPVRVSPSWGSGGFSTKPIFLGDGFMYCLVKTTRAGGATLLKRFNRESFEWDATFVPTTYWWQYSWGAISIEPGEILSVMYHPSGRFGLSRWNTNGSGAWTGNLNDSMGYEGLLGIPGGFGWSDKNRP